MIFNQILLLCLVGLAPAKPSSNPLIWPGAEWSTALPEQVGADSDKLEILLDYVFPENFEEMSRKGVRTDALVLVRGGQIFYEKYRAPVGPKTKHTTWSSTKSVLGVLVGIAEHQKFLHRLDLVRRFVADESVPKDLRIDHLLSFTSGYGWNETYEFAPLWSDVIAMLYTEGASDMVKYVLGVARKRPPGERWSYSSGDSVLLSRVLQNALPQNQAVKFLEKNLFQKLQMNDSLIETDRAGTWVGSSYLHASARDMARFGLLLLREGRWKNEMLVSNDWIDFMRTPAEAVFMSRSVRLRSPRFAFSGKHLWVNSIVDSQNKVHVAWKDAPADAFCASGHWGQSVFVIPSLDVVAVRLSDDRDRAFRENTFLKLVADLFRAESVDQRESKVEGSKK